MWVLRGPERHPGLYVSYGAAIPSFLAIDAGASIPGHA